MADGGTGDLDTEGHPRRHAILVVVCLGMMLIIINSSSLNVALPTLARELDATNADLQWIVASYSLVFAGLLFSSGSLGDRYGRKWALLGGLLLFGVASGAASLSTQAWHVVAARGVMGLAAALLMPSTLSILVGVFPAHERARAIATWAGVTGVAGTIGPLSSGWLLERHSFASVFLVNLPVAALAAVGTAVLVPRSRDPEGTPLDPRGALLSVVALTTFVYGLISAPAAGWASPRTVLVLAAALVAGAAFVAWELRCPAPMLDVRLFTRPAFRTATFAMTTAFLALFGASFLLAQYFQLVAGYSPLSTALRFLPTGVTLVAVSALTPRLGRRFGAHRTAACGLAIIGASMAAVGMLRHDSPFALVLASMLLLMTGLGLSLSPLTATVMAAVPVERPGSGSATNNSTRELGGALGVAILGSWASSRYAARLGDVAGLAAADQQRAATSLADALEVAAGLPEQAAGDLTRAARIAFVDGQRLAVVVPLVLALGAAVLVRRHLPATAGPPPTGTGAVEAAEVAVGAADDPARGV